MTLDHLGLILAPEISVLRILGRLAFPIFAWMIAEGCAHTRNIRRYFSRIFFLAAFCQGIYLLTTGDWYMGILCTFSLSILLTCGYQELEKKNSFAGPAFILLLLLTFLLTVILPVFFRRYGFAFDYGFFGALLPLVLYFFRKNRRHRLLAFALMLFLISLDFGGIQYYSLIAVLLFFFYNEKPGKVRLKYFFYLYYPLHLALLEGIFIILR